MGVRIVCFDGVVITGSTESELISAAEAHFREAHPQLAGRLSREEILAMASGEDPEPAPGSTHREASASEKPGPGCAEQSH